MAEAHSLKHELLLLRVRTEPPRTGLHNVLDLKNKSHVSNKKHRFYLPARPHPKISRAKLVKVYLVAYIDNVMLAERRIVTDALEQTTRRNEIVMKKAIYLHPGDQGKRRNCAHRVTRENKLFDISICYELYYFGCVIRLS